MAADGTTISGDVIHSIVVTGDGNDVSLAIGTALSIPIDRRQIRPVERVQRGGVAARSELDLLNARTTPVPFFGRTSELAALHDWLEDAVDLSVHALIAPAGTGKTRLAMELCGRVDPAAAPATAGWTAGFLSSDDLPRLADAFATASYRWSGDTLLVVDYAGRSAEPLVRWLDRLAAASLAPARLRILLLERTAPSELGWWRTLVGVAGAASDGPRRSLLWNPDLRPDDLAGLADVADRRALFEAVVAAASARAGRPAPALPAVGAEPSVDARLAETRFANPLALVMAGVLASRMPPQDALGLRHLEAARRIAERELARLDRLVPAAAAALRHLAVFNALAGGLVDDGLRPTVAAELAAAGLAAGPADLVAVLRQEYPARRGADGTPPRLATPEPDLIGEAMIVVARLHAGEDAAASAALVERAYAAAGSTMAAALMRLLQDFAFPREDQTATPMEREDAEHLLLWLIRLADSCADVATLAPIVEAIPQSTLVLREIALDLTERIVGALVAGDAPAELLAPWVGELGTRLSALGRREPALAASNEAVDLYRALASERPDAFRPDLAVALNNLGNRLADLGHRESALVASNEAVDLYRALASERPDAFRPHLAVALNNLGNRLADLGHRESALVASHEAVDLYRAQASERPDAFRPALAAALTNFGIVLSELGRLEPALAASNEAVDLYRVQASERPDAFRPDLAMALNNLGNRLAALGRLEPALAASTEAVDLCRALASERPDAFSGNLSMSLGALADIHDGIGDHDAALRCTCEAVDVLRPQFLALPQSARMWMTMHLRRYFEWTEALGREPDLDWLAPIRAVFEQLRKDEPPPP